MGRESFLICDTCRKKVLEGQAQNWLSVGIPVGSSVTFSGEWLKPDIYGLYCSLHCLKMMIVNIENFIKNPPQVVALKLEGEG